MKPNIIKELNQKAGAMARHIDATYEKTEKLATEVAKNYTRSVWTASSTRILHDKTEKVYAKCKVLFWGNIIITILHFVLNLLSSN